jgi:hypothetical protein
VAIQNSLIFSSIESRISFAFSTEENLIFIDCFTYLAQCLADNDTSETAPGRPRLFAPSLARKFTISEAPLPTKHCTGKSRRQQIAPSAGKKTFRPRGAGGTNGGSTEDIGPDTGLDNDLLT